VGVLTDSYDRKFNYLRLSVTETCNYRCVYCLPNGCEKSSYAPLSVPEIRNLVTAFASLGVSKVRITGGEPTAREDIVEIVEAVASVPGIKTTALTTNAYRLSSLLSALKLAGLNAVNVSVDSLNINRFDEITGARTDQGRLLKAINGIEHALALGISSVKANVVLLKGMNDAEIPAFFEWAKETPISVRFIELMQTADNSKLFAQRHLATSTLQKTLLNGGWTPRNRRAGDGPAQVYQRTGYRGTIGLVAPYSTNFCKSCNRLRVTSTGALRLCLFGEADYPLRPLLQHPLQCDELRSTINGLLVNKGRTHRLSEGMFGNTRNLAAFGG